MIEEKMVVMSTGHLTDATCNEYLPNAPFAVFQKGDYGWIVYMADDVVGIPSDLADCIEMARSVNAVWIMFDRDADQTDGLPFYEW